MTEQNKSAAQMARGDYENTSQFSRLTRCAIAGTALGVAGYIGSSLFTGTFKPKPVNIISGVGGVLCGTLLGDLNLHSPTYEERADFALSKEGKYPSDASYREDKNHYVDRLKEQDQMTAWLMLNQVAAYHD